MQTAPESARKLTYPKLSMYPSRGEALNLEALALETPTPTPKKLRPETPARNHIHWNRKPWKRKQLRGGEFCTKSFLPAALQKVAAQWRLDD